MSIHTLDLMGVRQALASEELKAEQVVEAAVKRITKTEEQVQALLTLDFDNALNQARQMDKTQNSDRTDIKGKPLWGVVVTVKDALCTKGLTTTAGSKILNNFVPFYDATAVRKLREAGAIIIAKNNMDEFAMGSSTENSAFKTTHNPWNVTCVPGGSSGGSAASVSAMQCYASLGTDTGGSIRQPASLCGCVGIKPTYGRVSRHGVIAYGSSLDQVGPMARTVQDCAIVLDVIAGHDPKDSTSDPSPLAAHTFTKALGLRRNLKGLKIGIPKEFFTEGLDAEVGDACNEALRQMQSLGAELVQVSLPHTTASIATYYIVAMAEASSNLARFDGVRYGYRAKDVKDLANLYIQSRTEGFGKEVQRRIMLGTYVLSSGYYDAYFRKAAKVRQVIREDYLNALAQCDVICGPVSPVTAWKLGDMNENPLQMYLKDIYTLSLNLAGLPGLSLPIGLGKDSQMPVGMQILGSAFDEQTLISVGHILEQALPKLVCPL